jgi:prepilin-type N-terminal cleavage/methylation domain-containing protein
MTLLPPNRAHRRAISQGFTLVELIIVIALAAILMGLLLPSLASAKEKSRRTVCKANMRQFWNACYIYGMDNSEMLPTASDNHGHPRTISLSDTTYTNLVSYLSEESKLMACPNIVFGTQNSYDPSWGHLIGYNYLAEMNPSSSSRFSKTEDVWVAPKTIIDDPTNVLLADANYWSPGVLSKELKIAPHAKSGGVIANGTSFTTGLQGKTSADIGAVGGNISLMDGSVTWRNLKSMGAHPASGSNDPVAYGAW